MKLGIACSPWSFCKPIWRSYGEPIGRRYRGYRVGESIQTAVTIVLVSQILIWTATAASYLVGINTFFNYPVAITGSTEPVSFGIAMAARAGGLVANCIAAAILGALGWSLGGLIPAELKYTQKGTKSQNSVVKFCAFLWFSLLLRCSENGILCSFRHAEFQNGFCRNFDFLTGCWVAPHAGFSFLFYKFSKSRKCKLTLFGLAVSEISESHHKVLDLFLGDTCLRRHFRYELGLGHLCHHSSLFYFVYREGFPIKREPPPGSALEN